MILREYQQRTIDQLYDWLGSNTGHPCVVLPTGAGKSHIVAALCKDALQNWPETRVLMLTHVKELIEQNAEKMRLHWPGAPMGIYSASIGKRDIGEPITFGGIQSLIDKAERIGHLDLVIIDECHLVNHKAEGGYRQLIDELLRINPSLRVIGLTATPYRMGHGLITDKPALFDGLIEPVLVEELIHKGYLSTLRSKVTSGKLDVSGVHKRGGDYIESELQAAVDTKEQNARVVAEVMQFGHDRNSWLFFCTGVKHAHHVAEILRHHGVTAECVTGETPKKERERILSEFKAGRIRALTNANVLTTGFDAPGIDLIAMLRPTMSPGLYVQMAGRGLRTAEGKSDCLVLDFAGVVSTHGPITAVQPPVKAKDGDGEAPVKVCAECSEIVPISTTVCPACGEPFPEPEPKKLELRNDDIMGLDGSEMNVSEWEWRVHTSRTSGMKMLACTYYGDLSDMPITEYLPLLHGGYAGEKALAQIAKMAASSGASLADALRLEGVEGLHRAAKTLTASVPPALIEYRKDGKFFRVTKRVYQ